MTLFERIANREIPATIVFEDDDLIAFRDIAPQAPIHVVITTKRAIATPNDIAQNDASLIGRMVLAGAVIAKAEGIAERGYRLVMNCNRDGGQSIDHIHMHLLGGRQMGWPPG